VVAGRRKPLDADQFARQVGMTDGEIMRAKRKAVEAELRIP
jgi:hypothetical protein